MFADPQEEKTSGWSYWVRTQDAGDIIPENQVITPSWVLMSRRLVNDQVLGKILYISMSTSNMRLSLDADWIWECKKWHIEWFFSYGSTNMLKGSGVSNLAALGVGWEEQLLHFCFSSIGARFIIYVLKWL